MNFRSDCENEQQQDYSTLSVTEKSMILLLQTISDFDMHKMQSIYRLHCPCLPTCLVVFKQFQMKMCAVNNLFSVFQQ